MKPSKVKLRYDSMNVIFVKVFTLEIYVFVHLPYSQTLSYQ